MATPVTMPQLAETTTEGTIGRWQKQVGQRVKRYEPLVDIMTDKVNVEMTSPVTGILREIVAAEGETVPVGGLLARIEEEGTEGGPAAPDHGAADRPAAEQAASGEPPMPAPGQNGRHRNGHEQRLTPVVARLAAQYGVDVSQIRGTGISGRVTKQDLLAYVEQRNREAVAGGATVAETPAPPPIETAAPPAVTPVGLELSPAQREAPAPEPAETIGAGPDEEAVAVTPLRRAIAENMVRSRSTAPDAWSMVEVDMTGLVRWREAIKEEFRRREGVDLTYLPFAIKAVTEALRDHPQLNASWAGDHIILKKRINIGIAVNRDDGLIVPVIHDAGRLSITGLAHAIADLVNRARSNTLGPADVSGGTFTVNNTGALGVVLSYPIMVPGQAAILTTEAIVKRPVIVDDAIAIRSMMNMALSFDHRVTDGGVVGSFLRAVKNRLQQWGPGSTLS